VEDDKALELASAIGFPLMVKAAEGGGGIGIHFVESPEELTAVMERARFLSQSAFGSPRIYLERYIEGASHIEVQILGDNYSNLVHLYERDCTIQRRNQKVVEETPSVKLGPEQRRRLTSYALTFARHIGYTNAGTVEFLFSREGDFFFLEMNTRLQVEHAVTEMVTGLDLVELQVRIAAGEPLPLRQEDVRLRGHAVEARIYPEDPETFMPSAGVIQDVREPSGEHLRVDSALFPGYEVTTYYDPLLAKVIAWGKTREKALERLYMALREFRIEGVKTNIPTIRSAITHISFIRGTYSAGFLSRVVGMPRQRVEVPPLPQPPEEERREKEMAAAIGVALLLSQDGRYGRPVSPRKARGPSPWKLHGRREQMLSRMQGRRGWR
jgi:acetyl/propionyl-CoA carboxylase alpha subunit